MIQIHATCVSLSGAGVLLRGRSGAGKSDLALRLIEGGARLVADDRVDLARQGDRLLAACPAPLAGLLEVRGLGILPVPADGPTPVLLLVDLVPPADVPRLPEPQDEEICGVTLPRLSLAPFEASAAAKLRLAAATAMAQISTEPGTPSPAGWAHGRCNHR
ncbi:HPr kinase/phosphorylase [Oleisolibacter albus]|uniref:HPr kinase/phosphorylase n=1 Tax=Oleisolibacter albus TaxID=2171757 RepID=UPI000DF471A4|nr:HPr kinase/phosphatase C-terminal domain-containing protein [Oleisolibacter albus]